MINKSLYKNIDFSFGKGVGSKIYGAINKAKHSVFVLTPYITNGYVDFLLRKREEGVNVTLVTTTDAQKGNMNDVYRNLLHQHCIANDAKIELKRKAERWCFLSGVISLLLWIAGVCGYMRYTETYGYDVDAIYSFRMLFFPVCICIIAATAAIYSYIHKQKVFSYTYSTRIPLTVLPSMYTKNIRDLVAELGPFVHAKIYIIDNKDIFIGSANLTQSGLRHNIESFIKISDHESAKGLVADIERYIDTSCTALDVSEMGPTLFHEAPY